MGTFTLLLVSTSLLAAGNLVPNGDFSTDADGVPDGWSYGWGRTHNTDTAENSADRQQPATKFVAGRDGAGQALEVVCARADDDGVWSLADVDAVPGCKIYKLSAWVKATNVKQGQARVCLVFLGEGGKWLGASYDAIVVSSEADWRRYVAYVAAPGPTTKVRVRLWTNMNRTGTITAVYDDVSLEPTELTTPPPLEHVDLNELPKLTPAQRQGGFVSWASPITKLIFPETKPTAADLARPLQVLAIAGREAYATVAVRALEPAKLTVSAGALKGPNGASLPATALTVRPARYLNHKLWARDDRVLATPRYLLPAGTSRDLAQEESSWWWLSVDPPANAPAGDYTGQVTIRSARAAQELPLTVKVYDLDLGPEPDVAFGFYDNAKVYEGDSLEAKWRRQRAIGMTTVGYYGNFGGKLSREGSTVTAEVAGSELATAVETYQQIGFPQAFFWLMGRDLEKFALEAGPLESDAFANDYLAAVKAILAYGKAHDWPELILQPVDEAFEHRARFDAMVRMMGILRQIPGLRLEADGMNGNPTGLEQVMPLIDIFALHDGPFYQRGKHDPERWRTFEAAVAEQRGEIWFYNVDISSYRSEMARFMSVWHPIRTGVQGIITWQYQTVKKDPYAPPGGLFYHEWPAIGDEPGGPSPSFLAMREGIEEYRLYRLVQQQAKAGKPAAAKALAELRPMLDRIDYGRWQSGPTQGVFESEGVDDEGRRYLAGDLKAPTGWSHDDYDRARELLLEATR